MATELYEKIIRFSDALEAEGYHEWSQMLSDSIEYGSTGSEILMASRFHLINLLESDEIVEPSLRIQARGLLKSIDGLIH